MNLVITTLIHTLTDSEQNQQKVFLHCLQKIAAHPPFRSMRTLQNGHGLMLPDFVINFLSFSKEGNNFKFGGHFDSLHTSPKVKWSRCNIFLNNNFSNISKYN